MTNQATPGLAAVAFHSKALTTVPWLKRFFFILTLETELKKKYKEILFFMILSRQIYFFGWSNWMLI